MPDPTTPSIDEPTTPTQVQLDTARHTSPYTFGEKVKRIAWSIVEATAFRWSWPTWYGYRAWLLRCFGADVHPHSRLRRTCTFFCPWNVSVGANTASGEHVWFYAVGKITVGDRVTLSHGVTLCAGSHDYTDPVLMPMLRPPIAIRDDVWVATEAFVGPGVTVGNGAILGARGCAFADLEPWTIYGGNPAKPIKARPRKSETVSENHESA